MWMVEGEGEEVETADNNDSACGREKCSAFSCIMRIVQWKNSAANYS